MRFPFSLTWSEGGIVFAVVVGAPRPLRGVKGEGAVGGWVGRRVCESGGERASELKIEVAVAAFGGGVVGVEEVGELSAIGESWSSGERLVLVAYVGVWLPGGGWWDGVLPLGADLDMAVIMRA